MSDPVLFSADEGVAEIRFNRPERLNSLDIEVTQSLVGAVERTVADETVHLS